MFVVDTNLLIYAAIEECPQHTQARSLLESWRLGIESWFITWPIVYEFMRVTTHRSVFARPLKIRDAWRFLETLLSTPNLEVLVQTQHHAEVLGELVAEFPRAAGNLLHDLHTVALMREHGVIEIRTADTDFHQFKFLSAVNPL